ncbi:hypothetical protein Tco_0591790 [Tanacetum coccineum]
MIQKEFVDIELLKSSQPSSVNEFVIINIPEEDVEPQPNLPLQEIIVLDPDDHPMWENEPTQAILDVTTRGIFLYKIPNQAFQFLNDKVLFELDWSNKLQMKPTQISVALTDGSNSNDDNSRLMEKLEALIMKMDSQFQSLKEELQDMRNKYYDLKDYHASKACMNDDTPMYERHEVNCIQSGGSQNKISHDMYSLQSHSEQLQLNNDSEKSLT